MKLFTNTKPLGMSALEIGAHGSSFAYIENPASARPLVKLIQTFASSNSKLALRNILFDIVSKNNLFGLDTTLVLHPKHYRLLLIERPKVLEHELLEAAKWQIKDMIDYPLEEIVVDVFLPPTSLEHLKNKLYVVVANKYLLNSYISLLQSCELNPVCVDIHELAVRNILKLLTSHHKDPVAFIQTFDQHCLLLIYQNGELNFVRHINLNTVKNGASKIDRLGAEIEHSFYYYQAEFKGVVPKQIFLAPLVEPLPQVREELSKYRSFNIEHIDLNNIFVLNQQLNAEQAERCLTVLGAALGNRN